MAARDDDRAAVVGAELGEVRERLYEVAVEQPVAGVGAVGRARPEVEVEFRFGINVGVRVAGVDDGLGLGEAHDSADDLLRHADEAGVGHVGENGRIGLEDMGEVHVGRRVAGHTAVSDGRAGRVADRLELALEVLEGVEHSGRFFVGQRVLDHDVPVDVEVVALGGRESRERSFEGVGGVSGHNLCLLGRTLPPETRPVNAPSRQRTCISLVGRVVESELCSRPGSWTPAFAGVTSGM